jgi:hypothetical protein
MIVNSPEIKHVVDDYEVVLTTGMVFPLTIDRAAGDTIQLEDTRIVVKLAAKPSLNDPAKVLPEEDVTVFMSHVVAIQHRLREVVELTPEQKHQWTKVVQELSGTVN